MKSRRSNARTTTTSRAANPPELRRETEQTGGWSLAQLCASLEWGDDARRATLAAIKPIAQLTAFAFAACAHEASAESVFAAYAFSWVENQVAAALKAVPFGQLAGQRIIVALRGPIDAAVQRARFLHRPIASIRSRRN